MERKNKLKGKELLTPEQRAEFLRIPSNMSEEELGRYYSLSPFDLEVIKRRRRDHNRLGFAVQLCVLRYPGWSITDVEPIPHDVLEYIAKQIGCFCTSPRKGSLTKTATLVVRLVQRLLYVY